jgi:urate oxidase
MFRLAENRYGKSRIRLVRVKRDGERHNFIEWAVEVSFRGDFDSCFEDGDNSKVLTTDTMKNTVYSLARDSSASCMEEFATELIDFLLSRNLQVSQAEVAISEKPWEHVLIRPLPSSQVRNATRPG